MQDNFTTSDLKLFQRVDVYYETYNKIFRGIIACDEDGNKFIVYDDGSYDLKIPSFQTGNRSGIVRVYAQPPYPADAFEFNEVGGTVWESKDFENQRKLKELMEQREVVLEKLDKINNEIKALS